MKLVKIYTEIYYTILSNFVSVWHFYNKASKIPILCFFLLWLYGNCSLSCQVEYFDFIFLLKQRFIVPRVNIASLLYFLCYLYRKVYSYFSTPYNNFIQSTVYSAHSISTQWKLLDNLLVHISFPGRIHTETPSFWSNLHYLLTRHK